MRGGDGEDRGGGRRRRVRPAAAGADRAALRTLRRRRAAPGLAPAGQPRRPGGGPGDRRPPGCGGRRPGRAGHRLPHLLDDQADHVRRRDEAVGAGGVRAEGPRRPVHPRLRGHAGLPQRLRAQPHDGTGVRADPPVAPAHAHVRAHLRLPPRPPGRRDVPQPRVRVGLAARRRPRGGAARPGRACRCCSSPAGSGTTRSPPTSSAGWSRSPRDARWTSSCARRSPGRSA